MSSANPMYRLEAILDGITVGANTVLVIWEGVQESLEELFVTGSIEIIVVIGKPSIGGSRESREDGAYPAEYIHMIPVTIMALTSDNVYLTEAQMVYYLYNMRSSHNPTGEQFILDRPGRTANITIGERVIYRTTYNVRYRES